jgi:hypothetical protein
MFIKSRETRIKSQGNCRLPIADRGLNFPNPKSETRNPKSRAALSLTEVLIAMGILTLGLLGVASVFPVGSYYMHKAEISDKASAIGQSVMSDIMARGMLNPWAWYVMVPFPQPNLFFQGIDGKYAPVLPLQNPPVNAVKYTFTRPFAEALAAELKVTNDPVTLAKQFGHAFVIDPMGVAAVARNSSDNNNVTAYAFPATAYATFPWNGSTYYGTHGWDPWRVANRRSGEETWPIRRVTFQRADGWPLDQTMAESLFRGSDDLSYDFPPRDDRPAIQTWDKVNVGGIDSPLARKWTGDYSWIVSVVPTTNAARDGMARNPEGFAYEVSVVVFYKRALPAGPPITDLNDAASNERMVSAKIISTGMNGGELLLTDMGDVTDTNKANVSPFKDLKSGQWIMLCGPHPNSSTSEPRFVMKWYQVISIEQDNAATTYIDSTTQRLVTVRGPEWPWRPKLTYPASQQNSDVARLSDDLCVGIFRGAVAVHTKTMRLESASAVGTSTLAIPGSTPRPPYGI